MANHQSDLAGKVLERISNDWAVQAVFQRLLDEVRGFRAAINELSGEMANPTRQRYLTPAEVTEMFGVSEATVRKRVNDETWPAWRDSRQMRFGPKRSRPLTSGGRPKPPQCA